MQLEGPLTNLGDLGVVDLDLIDSVRRNRSRKKRDYRKDAALDFGRHWLPHRQENPGMLPCKGQRMVAPRQQICKFCSGFACDPSLDPGGRT